MKSWIMFGLIVGVSSGLLLACGHENSAIPVVETTPTPVATPTPTPTPTPLSVYNYPCHLPPSGADPNKPCDKIKPLLGTQVNLALDQVIAEHPDYFNLNDVNGSAPRILKPNEYFLAVAANLRKQGVCMKFDNEEIAVKVTNDWNEQWNIFAGVGYMRRAYATTCTPSWW